MVASTAVYSSSVMFELILQSCSKGLIEGKTSQQTKCFPKIYVVELVRNMKFIVIHDLSIFSHIVISRTRPYACISNCACD